MQRLLQVITAQNQQQNQKILHFQQQHTDILAALTQVAQNTPGAPSAVPKVLQAKDLPQYSAQAYNEQLNFLTRFEMVGQVHQWKDAENKRQFAPGPQKNPASNSNGNRCHALAGLENKIFENLRENQI